MSAPCGSCPWRTACAGGPAIPGFSIQKARDLACTVGNDDGFRTVMACHGSPEGDERPCIGYIAVEGWGNLNVRLMAATGRLDLGEIADDCAGIDLFPTFADMLDNLEEIEARTNEETRRP